MTRAEEDKYRAEAALAAIGDGVTIQDSGFRILYQNRVHKALMGEHLGRYCYTAYAGRGEVCEGCPLLPALREGKTHTVERSIATDRGAMHLEITVSPVQDGAGRVTAAIEVVRDVTGRKEMEERLRYLSSHDVLTGLYNRSFFEQELARHEKGRHFPLSIVMADVDDLKTVNDSRGHAAGDDLLKRAALLFGGAFRAEDVVARVGGDEFAVLLPDADEKAAEEAMERVRKSVRAQNDAREDILSLSLGWATANEGGEIAESLKQADRRMYRDKLARTGRPPRHAR